MTQKGVHGTPKEAAVAYRHQEIATLLSQYENSERHLIRSTQTLSTLNINGKQFTTEGLLRNIQLFEESVVKIDAELKLSLAQGNLEKARKHTADIAKQKQLIRILECNRKSLEENKEEEYSNWNGYLYMKGTTTSNDFTVWSRSWFRVEQGNRLGYFTSNPLECTHELPTKVGSFLLHDPNLSFKVFPDYPNVFAIVKFLPSGKSSGFFSFFFLFFLFFLFPSSNLQILSLIP